MRLKFLVGIVSEDFDFRPGQIAYIERDLAEKWVASGIAVHLPITIADGAAVKEQSLGQQ